MKDYSQNGEQRHILEYFGTEPAAFLSIGENDGECLSNVRALALSGWDGCAVEPAPMAFKRLQALYAVRPDIKCVNAAITTHDGPVDFYDCGTHLHKGDTSLLSTTRPEELARWKRSGEQFTKTTVRGITFATLLKETGLTRADFISIDAEGVDLAILTQIDLTALGTRMVCVEVNNKDQKPFIDYCAKHGLRLHRKCVENLIFAR